MTDSAPTSGGVTTRAILSHTAALLRRSFLRVLAALALLTAPGVAIDAGYVSGDGERGLNLLLALLSLVLQFWLTKALLEDLGWHGSGGVRFPAFFVMVFATGLGIALGLILLVVPGVVLFVRWSIAAPILLGSDEGAINSIRHSWHGTRGHFRPILGALLAIYAPAIGIVAAAYLLQPALLHALPAIILTNLVVEAGIVAGWHAAVAICVLIVGPPALSEVFT